MSFGPFTVCLVLCGSAPGGPNMEPKPEALALPTHPTPETLKSHSPSTQRPRLVLTPSSMTVHSPTPCIPSEGRYHLCPFLHHRWGGRTQVPPSNTDSSTRRERQLREAGLSATFLVHFVFTTTPGRGDSSGKLRHQEVMQLLVEQWDWGVQTLVRRHQRLGLLQEPMRTL